MASLIANPIQYYYCFISHSSKDKQFVEQLFADLQNRGVLTWYFPEDARWGETVWGEIDRNIRLCDKEVLIRSDNSLTSGPVLREVERALMLEDQAGKRILFPVMIDDYVLYTWEHERKADDTRKVIGDFEGWEEGHGGVRRCVRAFAEKS